jgi:plastocyanin
MKRFNTARSRVFGLAASLGLLGAAVATATLLPSPHAGAHAAAAGGVKIANFAFGPQAMTVAAGTTVVWTNADDDAHSVVADAGAFRSKAMDTDDKFSFTFTKPGAYAYHCGLHPRMIGRVVVQ